MFFLDLLRTHLKWLRVKCNYVATFPNQPVTTAACIAAVDAMSRPHDRHFTLAALAVAEYVLFVLGIVVAVRMMRSVWRTKFIK